MAGEKDQVTTIQVERTNSEGEAQGHLAEKARAHVQDGDEALKILHTHYEPYTKEEEKKVLRKIDRHMVLVMLVVNGIQFVDKQTIAQAATYGIIQQANLQGQEFSLLISLFYIGYLIAQYPVNVLMQRYPTGKVITVFFVLWGATLAASGGAYNFATLAAARFFLGVFESCVNPGFILITSSWWKREEQTARVGLWYCANGLVGGPAGLIFWAIAHINVGGLYPYQWMFIIFGLFTVVVGVALWWILPDSPLDAKFLNDRERIIAIERLKSNKTGVKNTTHKPAQIKELLTDVKVWMLVFAVFCHNMTNSLQTTFTGLIIKGFGYSTYEAVLLSIPPGIVMAVTMLTTSIFLSTKYGEGKRIFTIIFCYCPGIIACVMLRNIPLTAATKAAHLGAVMIIPMVAASAGITYSLLASNLAGYTKKTVAGAIFFASNAVSNIISPQTFLAREAPRYETGVAICLVAFSVNIALFICLYVVYYRTNKQRDQDPAGVVAEDETEDLIESFSDLTDRQNLKLRYKL